MKLAVRIVTTLVLVALLLFCVFGFLATYEPMDHSTQIMWRIIYGVAEVMVIAGIIVINRRRAAGPQPKQD